MVLLYIDRGKLKLFKHLFLILPGHFFSGKVKAQDILEGLLFWPTWDCLCDGNIVLCKEQSTHLLDIEKPLLTDNINVFADLLAPTSTKVNSLCMYSSK